MTILLPFTRKELILLLGLAQVLGSQLIIEYFFMYSDTLLHELHDPGGQEPGVIGPLF